jgi:hypothetical protein
MENKWRRIKKELGLESSSTEMTPEALAGEVGGVRASGKVHALLVRVVLHT